MGQYSDKLEHYQFQMGADRGRLATALDMLTDTLALVGQHGVYCRSQREPDKPAMDIRLIMGRIEDSKGLILETMEELRGGER